MGATAATPDPPEARGGQYLADAPLAPTLSRSSSDAREAACPLPYRDDEQRVSQTSGRYIMSLLRSRYFTAGESLLRV